jgi:hypothetical protein
LLLGVRLALVEDPEAMARIRRRLVKRWSAGNAIHEAME